MDKINYTFQANSPCPSTKLNEMVTTINALVDWVNNYMAQHPTTTDIKDASVIGLDEKYTYEGEPIKPNVTLYLGGKLLEENVGFVADYKNNDAIGTATVKYYGLFPYSGQLTKTFGIEGQKYTLSYDVSDYASQGITAPASKQVSVVTSSDLTSPGPIQNYSFVGWFESKTAESAYTGGTLTSAKTLYARYKQNQFTITFNSNGHGTAPSAITTGVMPDLTKAPYVLSADGYAFGGWYTDEACTTAAPTTGTAVTSAMTLYAKWVCLDSLLTLNLTSNTITASADTGATVELYKGSTKLDSVTDSLTATATYKAVVSALGKTQTAVITCTYDKDAETLEFTSTAGSVVVTKGSTVITGKYNLYSGTTLQTGTLTIVDDASNTAQVVIEEN